MTDRNCSGVSRVAGTAVPTPALFTRMSTRPNSSLAARALAPRTGAPQAVDAPGAEYHVGACLSQSLRERDSESAGRTGDDGYAVVDTKAIKHGHSHTPLIQVRSGST